MSGLCQGKEVDFKDLLSTEQQNLRKQLVDLVSKGLGKGATPYKGPISVGADPLQLMAANIMSNLGSGKNYAPPKMSGMNPAWMGPQIPSAPVGGSDPNPWSHPPGGGPPGPVPPTNPPLPPWSRRPTPRQNDPGWNTGPNAPWWPKPPR